MKKKWIIPIFIPHYGCQHQCVFCNQRQITGQTQPVTPSDVFQVIEEWLARIDPQALNIEVAFYGGSFTALSLQVQQQLLMPAKSALMAGKIRSIRISTRPDCITPIIMELLKESGVSTVELGVQSLDDQVLSCAERGHTSDDVLHAVQLLKNQGFTVGIQLMPGLPGESFLSLVTTTVKVIALAPQFVRIYPVIVIEGTPLAKLYREQRYQPLSLQQAIQHSAFMNVLFEKHQIPVIRMGLQATVDLDKVAVVLAGPYHPAFGEMVTAFIYKQSVDAWLEKVDPLGEVKIHCSPQIVSKVRGQKNHNMQSWLVSYPQAIFTVIANLNDSDNLVLEYNGINYNVKKINQFSC